MPASLGEVAHARCKTGLGFVVSGLSDPVAGLPKAVDGWLARFVSTLAVDDACRRAVIKEHRIVRE
jgi:hypothetical protein